MPVPSVRRFYETPLSTARRDLTTREKAEVWAYALVISWALAIGAIFAIKWALEWAFDGQPIFGGW